MTVLNNILNDNQATPEWDPKNLKPVSDTFEGRPLQEILNWGFENFAPDIALATGFGPEGIVLMHHVSQIRPETTVFYLDTALLFPETYALRDELEERLGIRFTAVHPRDTVEAQAEKNGPELWTRDPNLCCYLRKVEPQRRFLATQKAWISGIRRDQTLNRARAGLVEWDAANSIVKLNPLANWSGDQVWDYIHQYDLPFNRLHLENYPSIGCWPCTRPVAPGDDPRSGRWAGSSKTECGIHLQPKSHSNKP